ncbi:YigZ family protein [Natronomonas sp. LN261]|uniref:IMPACT family protein n=1 Tax=Natronomonas sp. LN261 TaxID=2750669 RepID=UPI0015EFBC9E
MSNTDADVDVGESAYATIAGRATVQFRIQGSEFIGHASPVETVEDADGFIGDVRAEYSDATHNVPAYRVRADPFREYTSDDGEPSGSAGKPMLSVLRGRDLENVCVVVTRYFGGTELGIGGLVRAYSAATKDALDAAETVQRRPQRRFQAVVDYDDSGTVRGILESEAVDFEAEYGERVTFDVSVPVAEADDLLDRLRSATSDRIERRPR